MPKYNYSKYCTSKEGLKDMIDKYGVAIIPNVLNDDECQNMVNGI
jgi:hypothetical protein